MVILVGETGMTTTIFLTDQQYWKEIQDKYDDPNIKLLDDCIEGAKKRLLLYEMLETGMWQTIFRCDHCEEKIHEQELIIEFKRMKQEIIEWNTRGR